MKALYGVPRVAFLFTGGDHAHAHAHVVPLHEKTDITALRYITGEVARAPSEELAATAAQLRSGAQSMKLVRLHAECSVHHATLVIFAASTAHVMPVADLATRVAKGRNR